MLRSTSILPSASAGISFALSDTDGHFGPHPSSQTFQLVVTHDRLHSLAPTVPQAPPALSPLAVMVAAATGMASNSPVSSLHVFP